MLKISANKKLALFVAGRMLPELFVLRSLNVLRISRVSNSTGKPNWRHLVVRLDVLRELVAAKVRFRLFCVLGSGRDIDIVGFCLRRRFVCI